MRLRTLLSLQTLNRIIPTRTTLLIEVTIKATSITLIRTPTATLKGTVLTIIITVTILTLTLIKDTHTLNTINMALNISTIRLTMLTNTDTRRLTTEMLRLAPTVLASLRLVPPLPLLAMTRDILPRQHHRPTRHLLLDLLEIRLHHIPLRNILPPSLLHIRSMEPLVGKRPARMEDLPRLHTAAALRILLRLLRPTLLFPTMLHLLTTLINLALSANKTLDAMITTHLPHFTALLGSINVYRPLATTLPPLLVNIVIRVMFVILAILVILAICVSTQANQEEVLPLQAETPALDRLEVATNVTKERQEISVILATLVTLVILVVMIKASIEMLLPPVATTTIREPQEIPDLEISSLEILILEIPILEMLVQEIIVAILIKETVVPTNPHNLTKPIGETGPTLADLEHPHRAMIDLLATTTSQTNNVLMTLVLLLLMPLGPLETLATLVTPAIRAIRGIRGMFLDMAAIRALDVEIKIETIATILEAINSRAETIDLKEIINLMNPTLLDNNHPREAMEETITILNPNAVDTNKTTKNEANFVSTMYKMYICDRLLPYKTFGASILANFIGL